MKLEVAVDEGVVPDHLVRGRVIVSRSKATKKKPVLKSLNVVVAAKAAVTITDQYGQSLRNNKTFHSVSVPMIAKYGEIECAENENGGNSLRFELPFEVQLPYTLPPTFQGDYGGIEYTCRAEAVCAGNLQRKVTSKKEPVTLVLMQRDTHRKHSYPPLLKLKSVRKTESLLFDTSKIRLGMAIPGGDRIKPGQALAGTAEIINLYPVEKSFTVSIVLYQKITWFYGSLHRSQAKILDRAVWPITVELKSKGEGVFELLVPDELPVEHHSDFYSISYELRAEAAPFGLSGSCKLCIPLKIVNA